MNMDQRTVSKFVCAGSFPERAPRASGSTLLDGHRQYVASRAAEGCVSAAHVWHELQAQGFAGSLGTVRNAMARAHAAAAEEHGARHSTRGIACPSSRRAYAWLIGWKGKTKPEQKSVDHQRFVEPLCRIEPSIAVAGSLARHFLGLIHRRDVSGFDRWLARARGCVVPELRRFAASRDRRVVRHATAPSVRRLVRGGSAKNRVGYLSDLGQDGSGACRAVTSHAPEGPFPSGPFCSDRWQQVRSGCPAELAWQHH